MKIKLLVYEKCDPISFSCSWCQTDIQAKPGLAWIPDEFTENHNLTCLHFFLPVTHGLEKEIGVIKIGRVSIR